jgi:hypothetical protein
MRYQIILTDLANTQYVVAQLSNRADATAKFEFFKAAAQTRGTLIKSLNFRSIELFRLETAATYFRSIELCKLEPVAAWRSSRDAVNYPEFYRQLEVHSLN